MKFVCLMSSCIRAILKQHLLTLTFFGSVSQKVLQVPLSFVQWSPSRGFTYVCVSSASGKIFRKSSILASTCNTLSMTAFCLISSCFRDQFLTLPRFFILLCEVEVGTGSAVLGPAPWIIIIPPWDSPAIAIDLPRPNV